MGTIKLLYDNRTASLAVYKAMKKYTGRSGFIPALQIKMPRHEIIIMTGKWTREFGRRYDVDADTPRKGFLK